MAHPKLPDLSHSYKGQDYIFVGQLEDHLKQLECPICCDIVSEPLQTTCGHLFCRECYRRLRGGYGMGQCVKCPVCKQDHTTVQDSFNERRVKVLQVRCTNYQYGCQWVGNLGDEMQHRMISKSCHFEEIPCPLGCGKSIKRMTQSRHSQKCQMRPHSCEYCGEKGPYQKMVQDHLHTCRRYPVKCPNGCCERIPREDTASYKLKKEISTMKTELQAERQHVRDLGKFISQLKGDHKAQAQRMQCLERDAHDKTERIQGLERDAHDKTECIQGLERDAEAKLERIQGLERDVEAKLECIQGLERDVEAKLECIQGLQRDTTRKAQQIIHLETENSEKDKKLKLTKMFIAVAMVIIIFSYLYFIPLSIVYIADCT